jgi:glycosyl-4,4'-diaponeurosporenoate acyltransferase
MSKRQLPGRTITDLERFSSECRRGERTHLSIIAGTPAFAFWNSLDWAMMLTSLSVAANAPFVAVLRYNRARLVGLGHRGATLRSGSPARDPMIAER